MSRNKFITIAFALILLLPTLDSIFHFSPVKDLFEKRLPVARPEFSWSKDYPRKFEEFFNDNYGLRKSLISFNSFLMDKVFRGSPDARVAVGKDGWFYFDNRNSLLDAAGKMNLDDALVARGVEAFYRNWQEARAQNMTYLLVIAADKTTIYPEFLPDYIRPQGPHRIDKFIEALKRKYPDFPLLDLRLVMLAAKENEIVYHQTDTHWNKPGAHYGYLAMMKKLGLKPHLRSEFTDEMGEEVRGDISEIMGIKTTNRSYNLIPKFAGLGYEVNGKTVPKELKSFHKPRLFFNKNKHLPRLFSFKDSFMDTPTFFLAEHFSQSVYVNEFPCDLNFAEIKKFHPNFVIQEFWEGRIEEVLTKCN